MCDPKFSPLPNREHPLAHPDIHAKRHVSLPEFLRDADGAQDIAHPEDLPADFYGSELDGFPRHIVVLESPPVAAKKLIFRSPERGRFEA